VAPAAIAALLAVGGLPACHGSTDASAPDAASTGSTLVFAAASTADALQAHAKEFEAATGCTLRFSFASSQDLARQLKLGAPAQLFLSADPALVDDLVREGLVSADDTSPWMKNQLVIIVPQGAPAIDSAAQLAEVPHVALGDPDRVPAGRYARAWLQGQGAWTRVQPRVVPALDVRGALAMVESARAGAGIVYRSDAAHDPRVRITLEIPVDPSAPIVYRAGELARNKTACGTQLLASWSTPQAREIFTAHGFLP
jgi:molybdate transport system substrate-binding protein